MKNKIGKAGKKVAVSTKERLLGIGAFLLKWYVYLLVPLRIFMAFVQIKQASTLNGLYASIGYPKTPTFGLWLSIFFNIVFFIGYFVIRKKIRNR